MDITHPGQQLIFYFDVFVEFILYLLHGVRHILETILFHNFICFICPYFSPGIFFFPRFFPLSSSSKKTDAGDPQFSGLS